MLASGSGSVLESLGIRRAGAYGGSAPDLVALRRNRSWTAQALAFAMALQKTGAIRAAHHASVAHPGE